MVVVTERDRNRQAGRLGDIQRLLSPFSPVTDRADDRKRHLSGIPPGKILKANYTTRWLIFRQTCILLPHGREKLLYYALGSPSHTCLWKPTRPLCILLSLSMGEKADGDRQVVTFFSGV